MHFRSVKDAVARPLHRFGFLVARLPRTIARALIGCPGILGKAIYFLPGSRVRRMVNNFCHAAGRSDPWAIYSGMIDNFQKVALHFATLYRHGRAELVAQTVLDPSIEKEHARWGRKGLIVLVPHCAGAVLSSARLNMFSPTTLLVREPRDPARCELMLEYVKKLGPEFILARHTPPATVMRGIVRALHENKIVVGTTDLVRPGPDTIETTIFGQRIHSPGWPARLSARLNAPILPGYIHMEGDRIVLMADEGYVEPDVEKATQRWVSSFERRFRQYPSDWAFMLDKNWARILEKADGK